MPDVNILMTLLQAHLRWHRARLFVLCALVVSLLRLRTVALVSLAKVLNPRRPAETNYRRIQRFLAHFTFDFDALTRLLLALRASQEPLILVIDRSEWDFGEKTINLLVVGYSEAGIVVPLSWIELDKRGATNEEERIDLVEPLLKLIGPKRIDALVADREFIGERFFRFLAKRGVRFVVRVRKNARMKHRGKGRIERAGDVFAELAEGRRRHLREKRVVYGVPVYVVAAREGKEPWILVTNERPRQALQLYGVRWSVETLFGAFKSRGFDLEATHLRDPERMEKLVGVLALALVWAMKVGLWRAEQKAIAIKKHGRRAIALFRYGLDFLQEHLLNRNWRALGPAFHLLSCT